MTDTRDTTATLDVETARQAIERERQKRPVPPFQPTLDPRGGLPARTPLKYARHPGWSS